MTSHIADGSTVGLWRLNEEANPTHQYALAAATVNSAHNLGQATSTRRPLISGGPTADTYSRAFRLGAGTGEALRVDSPGSTFMNKFLATHRFKFWLYLEDEVTANGEIINAGGTDTSDAAGTNFLVNYYVDSATRRLGFFWEYNSGTNEGEVSTYTIPLRAWVELDVLTTITGANVVITVAADGTPVWTSATRNASNVAATVNPYFSIGAVSNSRNPFYGRIADVRLWDSADDSGDPFERWEFTEAPAAVDESGNGHHLCHSDFVGSTDPYIVAPVCSGSGRSRHFSQTTSPVGLIAAKRQELVDLFKTTHTVATWVYRDNVNPVNHETIVEYQGGGTTAEADNTLMRLAENASKVQLFSESGAATAQTYATTADIFNPSTVTGRETRHYIVEVTEDIAGVLTKTIYVDGVQEEEIASGVAKPTGGDNPRGLLWVGRGAGGNKWNGRIDEIEISAEARDATWVAEAYARGINGTEGGGGASANAPTIANVSPPDASQIGRAQAVSLDVVDIDGDLARVALWVLQDGDWILIHDGDSFLGRFVGSTRTAISNGFSYVISPAGGWRSSPAFRVLALDASGQEAVAA